MTFNDKVVFEHFSFQRSLQCCAPSIVTRTRLCCYITFQCDIAHDWKAICVHMAAKRRLGLQGLLDKFFTIVSKMPKGNCSTFWHFNSITMLAKRVIFSAQDNFQESHWTGMTFASSTAGNICRKLVELSTAGYPGTLQLLVISVGFSLKQEHFSNVFSGKIGP